MASFGLLRTTIHNIIDVARDRPYLLIIRNWSPEPKEAKLDAKSILALGNLPCEDVLAVVVSQVDLSCAADGNTLRFSVHRFNHVRHWEIQESVMSGSPARTARNLLTHSLFNPNRLTSRQLSHLMDIGKVEFAFLRLVFWGKHVLLPRLSQ